VGSGTELVERAIAGAYAALHGSDTDPRAIEAARENFAAKGLGDVRLVQADATTYEPSAPVTLVITNPPMGRRVARSAELAGMLDRFVDHAASVLRPRGRLVWMSPHPARSLERAKLAGLVLRRSLDVDMGGFVAQLQSFTKGS
jgi:23S rRNA G2445 N2-methylase RlmL